MGAGSSRQLSGSGCSALFGEEKKTLRHVLRLTGRIKKRLKIQEGELITVGAQPLRRGKGGICELCFERLFWKAGEKRYGPF